MEKVVYIFESLDWGGGGGDPKKINGARFLPQLDFFVFLVSYILG